jgi:hypothetical protein
VETAPEKRAMPHQPSPGSFSLVTGLRKELCI